MYSNGNIPLSALTKIVYPNVVYYSDPAVAAVNIVDGVYLDPAAATALYYMLDAYHAATGSYLHVNEGYRCYAVQLYYEQHPTGNGTPAPAGTSNHGLGMAIDLEYNTGEINWIRANGHQWGWYPYDPPDGDPIHFNYTGAPSGEAMPLQFQTTRTIDIPLQALPLNTLNTAEWPLLAYTDSTANQRNVAEVVPGASLFNLVTSLYITGLPVGESVYVRYALWSRANDTKSGLAATSIQGTTTGDVRGQYHAIASINQSTHRLGFQAFATVPGVTVDLWRVDGLAW